MMKIEYNILNLSLIFTLKDSNTTATGIGTKIKLNNVM